MKQMPTVGRFLTTFAVLIVLGACTTLEKLEEEAAIAEGKPAVSSEATNPVVETALPECVMSDQVKLLGGSGQLTNLLLGDKPFISGTDNAFYAPPGACLLKLRPCSTTIAGTTMTLHQYHVLSCDEAPADGCLTDLGNGNKVVYSEPCSSPSSGG